MRLYRRWLAASGLGFMLVVTLLFAVATASRQPTSWSAED